MFFNGAGRDNRRITAEQPQIAFHHEPNAALAGGGSSAAVVAPLPETDNRTGRDSLRLARTRLRYPFAQARWRGILAIERIEALVSRPLTLAFVGALSDFDRVIVVAL